MSKYSWTNHFL